MGKTQAAGNRKPMLKHWLGPVNRACGADVRDELIYWVFTWSGLLFGLFYPVLATMPDHQNRYFTEY